jgi:glycosyltransferase involved in cell wall biosynthesis
VLLFVGALGYEAHKGFDRLLEALAALGPGGEDMLLVAAGGGRIPWWRGRAEELGVAGRVRFLGHVGDVPGLLAAADLLVSPSRYEAYGLNVQEALCRGVPAIVSRSSGVAERLGPDLAELLVPDPEDAAALAGAILAWRSRREAFADAARRTGERLRAYSWSDMAEVLIRTIEAAPAALQERSA